MYKRCSKSLPLSKAKDAIMDYMEPGHEVALLWVPSKENDGAKRLSHLLELILYRSEATSSSATAHSHSNVIDLLHDMSEALKESGACYEVCK